MKSSPRIESQHSEDAALKGCVLARGKQAQHIHVVSTCAAACSLTPGCSLLCGVAAGVAKVSRIGAAVSDRMNETSNQAMRLCTSRLYCMY